MVSKEIEAIRLEHAHDVQQLKIVSLHNQQTIDFLEKEEHTNMEL